MKRIILTTALLLGSVALALAQAEMLQADQQP
jgi:hypothetical protein